MAADLDWIISNHGNFLERFGFNRDKIINEYETWKTTYPDYLTTSYFFGELLRQASLFNIKHANTEEEYASVNVEIISRKLEVSGDLSRENRDYLLQQLHINKLMISKLTLPYEFDVQIKAANCCSYCTKQNNKIYSFGKIIAKKYLPHARCKNEEGCKCSYSIVPLSDGNKT
jgi:hypothetical protein